jgi:two-component system sensor histidine kinase PilS (NtrC family)
VDRRIVYLMTFRTTLVTLLFGVVLLWELLSGSPLKLTSAHSQVIFGALVLAYGSTLLYSLLHHRLRRKEGLFAAVLALDVLLISFVVHITGGIQSFWTFLYPLIVVEAAIVGLGRWALRAAIGVTALFLVTTMGGYGGLIPTIEGQTMFPDRISRDELATAILVNLSAQVAIALLAFFLAEQLRRASAEVQRAEETIRDMVRLNEQILESLEGGIVTLDYEGRVLHSNPAAERLLGKALRDATQADLARALPGLPTPSQGAMTPQRILSRLEANTPESAPIPVEITVTRLLGEGLAAAGSILLIQDLTEIRAMEERVQRAERLAAVGRLAAGIAHEIRNPLAAVSGSLELLRSSPEASEEDRRLLEIALGEVERLDTLVKNLLGFARPRAPQLFPFDLALLTREVVTVFGQDPELGQRRLEVSTPAEGCPIEADPDQIRQVLWNLLRNAAEATEPGGHITVTLSRGDAPEDPWVRLRVEDDGPGISPAQLPKLFEPFFSTKDKGSGLGLATVHRILEDHGGRVELDSAPGKGAALVVLLPSARGA